MVTTMLPYRMFRSSLVPPVRPFKIPSASDLYPFVFEFSPFFCLTLFILSQGAGADTSSTNEFRRFFDTPHANCFRIRTYEKSPDNPFIIRTCKTQDLKSFRIRTYKKTGRGLRSVLSSHCFSLPRSVTFLPRWCGRERSSSLPETSATPARRRRQYLLCLASGASVPAPARHPAPGSGTPAPRNQAAPSQPDPDNSSCTAPSLRPNLATLRCSRRTSALANASSPTEMHPHRRGSTPLAAYLTPQRSLLGPPPAPPLPSSASRFARPMQTTRPAPHLPQPIECSSSSSPLLLQKHGA